MADRVEPNHLKKSRFLGGEPANTGQPIGQIHCLGAVLIDHAQPRKSFAAHRRIRPPYMIANLLFFALVAKKVIDGGMLESGGKYDIRVGNQEEIGGSWTQPGSQGLLRGFPCLFCESEDVLTKNEGFDGYGAHTVCYM
jgi:hypothetical protein